MSKSAGLSLEIKNAIVWLEKQPGVTSVVQGNRYNRTKHHHKPGWARVRIANDKMVHVAVYDKNGMKDVFVHAPKSPLRDRWVAALAGGDVVGSNGGPKIVEPQQVIKKVAGAAALADVAKPSKQIVQHDAAQIYDVTPELAAQWLEHNTRNRKLYQRVVNRYAADMKAGRWRQSVDAIGFDVNGAIINGQHRLWAVLEAGVTVPMTVMFGLQTDVVDILDDHLKRNLRDVATIRRPGVVVNTQHTGIANMLVQSSIRATAADVVGARERVSRQVQLDTLDRHMEAIEFVIRECFRSATMRSVTVAPVLTPMARAYYTQPRERLAQFARGLLTGMTESKDDVAVIKLRNILLGATSSSRVRANVEVLYRKTERALQAFIHREQIATLYEAADELFPLPEETPVKKAKVRK